MEQEIFLLHILLNIYKNNNEKNMLLVRFLVSFIHYFIVGRIKDPMAIHHRKMRVWLNDCDINGHMTNARYPSFVDLTRLLYFLQVGAWQRFVKEKWVIVLSAQTMTFIKEIKPFAQVDIETKLLCWDRKYFYFEHKFKIDGVLHAKALARCAAIKGKRVRAFDQFLTAGGYDIESPQIPPQVQAWIALMDAKKAAEE